MITNSDIKSGSDVCPSCKSDDWKSAKMVVMEGTTNTLGTLGGAVTDPGKFSGGVRNFLLSDRWFSWDYPIEAEIGLTSSTGLVEEVKRLMVSHSSNVQMPTPPTEPTKVGAFKREWNASSKPAPPISPKDPQKPEKPTTTIKAMFIEFIRSVFYFLIVLVIINIIFTSDTLMKLSSLIFGGGIVFIALYSFNKKLKVGVYEGKQKRWPEDLERYNSDMEKYKKDLDLHGIKVKEYERKRKDYNISMDKKERQGLALYQKQLAEYETEKSNIIKTRELLWERARICMRCGTAYIGSN